MTKNSTKQENYLVIKKNTKIVKQENANRLRVVDSSIDLNFDLINRFLNLNSKVFDNVLVVGFVLNCFVCNFYFEKSEV